MKRNERGITLIALAVTVTVLLILVTVTINTLTGDNGLLNEAEEVKMETIKTTEREYVRVAYQKLEMKLRLEGIDITPDVIETELKKYDEKVSVIEITESEIGDQEVVIQRETAIRYAEVTYTETNNKYIVPLQVVDTDATNQTITFKYDHDLNIWTNEDIVATAETTAIGYTLQTSLDGTSWENTDTQTLTENGYVYARLMDGESQVGDIFTGEVTNIDKVLPIAGTIKVTQNESEVDMSEEDIFLSTYSGKPTVELISGSDEESGHKSTTYTVVREKSSGESEILYEDITDAVILGISESSIVTSRSYSTTVYYIITVTTKDEAGNESSRTYNFSLYGV